MESLAEQGHFYSHIRLTKPVTTCFYCGFTVTKTNDYKDIVSKSKNLILLVFFCQRDRSARLAEFTHYEGCHFEKALLRARKRQDPKGTDEEMSALIAESVV